MCKDIYLYLYHLFSIYLSIIYRYTVCPRLSQESGQNISPKNSRPQRGADCGKVLKLVPKAEKQGLSPWPHKLLWNDELYQGVYTIKIIKDHLRKTTYLSRQGVHHERRCKTETDGPQLARELKQEGKEDGLVRLQEFHGLGKPLLTLIKKWAANPTSLESKCVEVNTLNSRFLLISYIKIREKFYIFGF